ncbi:MAG TPA: BON domain-containing protein [Gemmatimonadaceae bacterium]|nr:BON domain-containing protein [Gemmatimonadaceae bacterium]
MAWDNDFDNGWYGNRQGRDVWGVGGYYGAPGYSGYGADNFGYGGYGGGYGAGNYRTGWGPGYYGAGYGGYGYGQGNAGPGGYGRGYYEAGAAGTRNYGTRGYGMGYPGGYGQGGYGQRSFAGRGPRNYHRSDSRIQEDINDRLTAHPGIDASDVVVQVNNGEVTLTGNVDNRWAKREVEDIVDFVSGVRDVDNQLAVQQNAGDRETTRTPEREGRGSENAGRSRSRSTGATART